MYIYTYIWRERERGARQAKSVMSFLFEINVTLEYFSIYRKVARKVQRASVHSSPSFSFL